MDAKTVRRLVNYDPLTGNFTWRPRPENKSWSARWAGKKAFTAVDSNGYFQAEMLGRKIRAHRAAWIYCMGHIPDQIDHINGNRQDNRLSNLRSVSNRDNNRNFGVPKNNKSGVMGVRVEKRTGKWVAQIANNNRFMHLGTFDNYFDAVCARKSAEVRHGFHKNHGRHESWRCGSAILSQYNLEPKP